MQGGRPPQPSGTNRPSSSACPSHGRSRGIGACARCAAPRARWDHPGGRTPPDGQRPWQGRHTRSHPEPGSYAPARRLYCGVSPWETRTPLADWGRFRQEGPRAERGAPFRFFAWPLVRMPGPRPPRGAAHLLDAADVAARLTACLVLTCVCRTPTWVRPIVCLLGLFWLVSVSL